jgi:uncharacterized protein (DUF362 family)
MDRKDFLVKGVCVAAVAGVAGVLGCKSGAEGIAGAPVAAAPTNPNPAPTNPNPAPTNPSQAPQPTAEEKPAGAEGKVGHNRIFDRPPAGVHAAIAKDKEPAELVKAAIAAFGGVDAIIHKGDRVVIKPNLAWAREPEVAANTNPHVLKAVLELVKAAGAKEVLVVEHSCDRSAVAFEMSGAKEVCQAAGVKLVSLDSEAMYEEQPVTKGVNITSEKLPRDILECDVYINLPVLKHHSATNMTLALKNQMGAIWKRGRYHESGSKSSKSSNLHQSIADLGTALRPTLVIVDAVRALTNNGPKGPGNVKELHTVIVTHDMVCADALGAGLLGLPVDRVPHIKLAADAGVGRMDVEALHIAHV